MDFMSGTRRVIPVILLVVSTLLTSPQGNVPLKPSHPTGSNAAAHTHTTAVDLSSTSKIQPESEPFLAI